MNGNSPYILPQVLLRLPDGLRIVRVNQIECFPVELGNRISRYVNRKHAVKLASVWVLAVAGWYIMPTYLDSFAKNHGIALLLIHLIYGAVIFAGPVLLAVIMYVSNIFAKSFTADHGNEVLHVFPDEMNPHSDRLMSHATDVAQIALRVQKLTSGKRWNRLHPTDKYAAVRNRLYSMVELLADHRGPAGYHGAHGVTNSGLQPDFYLNRQALLEVLPDWQSKYERELRTLRIEVQMLESLRHRIAGTTATPRTKS